MTTTEPTVTVPPERTPLDQAYWERGQLVTALAKLYPAHIYTDPTEPAWPVLCVHLPAGAASWHFPANEIVGYLATLEVTASDWDGHTTDEKYRRLAAAIRCKATLEPTPRELALMALAAAAIACVTAPDHVDAILYAWDELEKAVTAYLATEPQP